MNIERENLPGVNAKPRIKTLHHDGKGHSFVTWETNEGVNTPQSPAAARASFDGKTTAPSEVLRGLREALELPGTAEDYHFALLDTYEWLQKQCQTNPDLLADFERLCLLDISLVQAFPQAITHGAGEKPIMALVPAFGYLIRIYEREGFLEDALAIARSAAACGQGTDAQERLTRRVQELKAEDG
jgi:hypothetical protein